jgi:hypothetical protein
MKPEHVFPDNPHTAFFLATVFRRLGGSFSIGSNGTRYFGRPEPVLFRMRGEGLPQMPDPAPHEKFHTAEEWRGAIKLVEVLLRRLSDADTDLIFDQFAAAAVDERKFVPSIEDPARPGPVGEGAS